METLHTAQTYPPTFQLHNGAGEISRAIHTLNLMRLLVTILVCNERKNGQCPMGI